MGQMQVPDRRLHLYGHALLAVHACVISTAWGCLEAYSSSGMMLARHCGLGLLYDFFLFFFCETHRPLATCKGTIALQRNVHVGDGRGG